jgi:periplasmic protein CpxP/Spy
MGLTEHQTHFCFADGCFCLKCWLFSPHYLQPYKDMRVSPILLISTIFLASATALAVPFVIHPTRSNQQSLPSTQLAQSQEAQSNVSENSTPRKIGKPGEILQRLNLTRDQFRQVSVVRKKYQPLIQGQARTVKTLQSKLRSLMASSAESSEVQNAFRELQKHRQDLQQLRFDSSLATRQILTPEQRKAFEAALDKRRAEKHEQR